MKKQRVKDSSPNVKEITTLFTKEVEERGIKRGMGLNDLKEGLVDALSKS